MRKLAVVLGLVACGGGGDDDATPDGPAPIEDPPELALTMREQIDLMESGAFDSAALTAAYLDRMARIDDGDTGVNAVLSLDPAATTTAATVDGMRGTGALLQGAVIIVKDNIDTAGLATTAGSIALESNVPTADAFAVARLRAANGVIVGKANLSEWANFRGYASTSGWSSLGGQTRHGLIGAYNPCGSSSGSAAAVASGTVSASLGTETNGSITCPASVNGVVGFKPTVGLVSRAGVIPISSTQDTIGPITKDVGDAARLMRVMAGVDPDDPATAAIPDGFDFDFEAPLATATLSGKRIGVLHPPGFQSSVNQVFDAQLAALEAAGATLIDVSLADGGNFPADEYTVLTFEFKSGINAYLASHPVSGQPATLAELIAFNTANSAIAMPYFGQEIFLDAQATSDLSSTTYLDAKQRALAFAGTNGLLAVLDDNNLDVIVAPSTGTAWLTNYETGDQFTGGSGAHAAVAGYPHLTVPMGSINALPIGMSFFGRPFDDAQVLAIGHAYEQQRGDRHTHVISVEPPQPLGDRRAVDPACDDSRGQDWPNQSSCVPTETTNVSSCEVASRIASCISARMTDIQVSCGRGPQDLAKAIAATLHGLVPTNPDDDAVAMGRLVRAAQERAELARGSRHDLPTVNFETIDPDLDWSEV